MAVSNSLTALYLQNPELANAIRRQQSGAAMMQQGADTSPIQSPWQGLARLAQGLIGGYEQGQANKEVKAIGARGEEEAADFARRLGGGLMQAPQPAPQPAAPPMPPTGSPDLMGLVAPIAQRYGVPINLALSLFKQESGGNPGAVGDGGQSVGLGQIQARTAADPGYGVAPMDPAMRNDPAANADFAMRYLVGKGRAMGATDLTNPAHQDIALRAYNGGGDPNYVQNVRRQMPGDAVQVAGPGAPAGPDMSEATRYAQMAQEAATSRNPSIRAQAPMLMQRAQMAQSAAIAAARPPPQEIEAHRLAVAAGLQPGTPEYQTIMRQVLEGKARGQTTTINMPQGQAMGAIPPGHMVIQDGASPGGFRMIPIPGGPADRTIAKEDKKEGLRENATQRAGSLVLEDIDRIGKAVDQAFLPATGMGASTLSGIPGTAAHDVSKLLDGIKANVAFDKLQQMREASPTGGALGAVSDREMALLQATLGSLEQSQSSTQFKENLARLKTTYMDIIHGPGKWKDAPADGDVKTLSGPAPAQGGARVIEYDASGKRVTR